MSAGKISQIPFFKGVEVIQSFKSKGLYWEA